MKKLSLALGLFLLFPLVSSAATLTEAQIQTIETELQTLETELAQLMSSEASSTTGSIATSSDTYATVQQDGSVIYATPKVGTDCVWESSRGVRSYACGG